MKSTKDYKAFVQLPGNREVNPEHVRHLIRKMTESGNLTQYFPVIVNERMEVIDGQHRLEALKELGWEVFYETKKHLNIDTVRAINVGHKNWAWKDYAVSFADLGNKSYIRFLELAEKYPDVGYSVLMYSVGAGNGRGRLSGFATGEFSLSMEQKEHADKLLGKYLEIAQMAQHHNRDFAVAVLDIMQRDGYVHKDMLHKLKTWGNRLRQYRTKTEYLRGLEDIYNLGRREEIKVRLF